MPTRTIQSVDRALSIIQAAAAADDGRTLSELADAAGVRTTTAHNLARTLVARGFLRKSDHPVRYHVGPALTDLLDLRRQSRRRRWAERTVLDLARRLPDATVTMSQARAGEITVLLRVSPDHGPTIQHPADHVLAPYGSASALVHQAWWPDEPLAAYRSRYPFDEYGVAQWRTPAQLADFLADARRLGYVRVPHRDGNLVMAVPLLSRTGNLVGTLGANIPADKPAAAREADVARILLDAARGAAEFD